MARRVSHDERVCQFAGDRVVSQTRLHARASVDQKSVRTHTPLVPHRLNLHPRACAGPHPIARATASGTSTVRSSKARPRRFARIPTFGSWCRTPTGATWARATFRRGGSCATASMWRAWIRSFSTCTKADYLPKKKREEGKGGRERILVGGVVEIRSALPRDAMFFVKRSITRAGKCQKTSPFFFFLASHTTGPSPSILYC